jgi:hypothetical protein
MRKPGSWPGFHCVVAGARLSNDTQIEIEPIALVAQRSLGH